MKPRPGRLAALLAVLAVSLALPAATPGAPSVLPADSSGSVAHLIVKPGGLIVQTHAYQVVLNKQTGAVLEVIDRISGARLVQGQNGCEWGATSTPAGGYIGGCTFRPTRGNRFSYRWSEATSTLTMTYRGDSTDPQYTNAVVTLAAHPTFFDLQLMLENHRGHTLALVNFPSDLYVSATSVRAGYAPNFLPGVRFKPGFFSRVGNDVLRYPSRWAFADYLALDVGRGHLALYSVNPSPNPLAPVDLGFLRNGAPVPCSGSYFCVTHVFETWIRDGGTWESPVVRVRLRETVAQTILDYRSDNGIDGYPSLAAKVGPLLDKLVRAPLIKADETRGLPSFAHWADELRRLPSPALLHPVGFQPGGFDATDPDFLPPDPQWGTTADFRTAVGDAHSLGQLVMPYLNASWWVDGSPTLLGLPPPLTVKDVSMQDSTGTPVLEGFGDRSGYIVSPWVPFVRERVAQLIEQWRTDVPVDCLFFDQIGARPWRRDFNPSEPTPLAYDDGWLQLMAPYAGRCMMVEDGWDRLAASFSGFHGGLLLMERQFQEPDDNWGAGNWEPYPLALWLFHDKVLLYQHDLYPETMTADAEALTWNEAFGFMLSYNWDDGEGTLESPWLDLVGRLQAELGPFYAGKTLTAFRDLTPDVTETQFGDYSVIANWSRTKPYTYQGRQIAPLGFEARTGARVLAGTFGSTWTGVTFG